jgi:phospholipid transport system substrate-binding protein
MLLRSFIFILLTSFVTNLAAADFSTPMGRVKDTTSRVISVLKNDKLARDVRWEKIAALIYEGFDFRSMSESVLSTQWKRATEDERKRFTEFFSQYIEETYRTKIEAYTNQKIIYKDEVIRGKRAVVETVIVTDSTEIPVNYKLKNNDGEWFAYDVVVEGVSLIANYRSTFSAIVKNEGMDGLMSDIQRRIDKFKKANAEKDTSAEI